VAHETQLQDLTPTSVLAKFRTTSVQHRFPLFFRRYNTESFDQELDHIFEGDTSRGHMSFAQILSSNVSPIR
jgi:hypothetical protein